MLSTAAWNAFLKTLEEPPPHVVFVLATTEAHKVPATIVDRCHRFDFQRPSLEQIAGVLDRVAAEEGIEVPGRRRRDDRPRGHRQLPRRARHARAARDLRRHARSKLDDVLEILGVADAELVLDTAEALADHDPKAALLAVERLSDSGPRLHAVHARPRPPTCATCSWSRRWARCPTRSRSPPSTPTAWPAQAERLSQGEMLRAIDLLAGAIAAVKDGSEPRIQLELALLKATQPQADLSLQALMFRIEQLEARLGGAAPRPSRAREQPRRSARPLRPPSRPRPCGRQRRSAAARCRSRRWPPSPRPRSRAGSPSAPRARAASRRSGPRSPTRSREENGDAGRRALRAAGRSALDGERLDGRVPERRGLREEEGRGEPGAGAAARCAA